MSKLILVTGATGFIGRALVRRLIEGGQDLAGLRCLVRDVDRAAGSGLPRASCVSGSLDDPDSLADAVAGADVVVHLAGLTRAVRRGDLHRVNAAGSGLLAECAAVRAPGVRFVHVSSLAAAGPSVDGAGTANDPPGCRPCSAYGRSKLRGELAMLRHAAELDWCVIRPPIVYGPGDDATRLLFRQATAPLAVVPWRRRPLSWIHVDDAALALERAIEARGVPGYFPIEGPERTDTDDLVRRLARACGRSARLVRIPMIVPRIVAPCFDSWARLTGRPTFLGSDKMREASAVGWVGDAAPARDRLGFQPRIGAASGLAMTAAAEGFVGPDVGGTMTG